MRQADEAMIIKHDDVWKMAVDGVYTLSVSSVAAVLTGCVC